MNRKRKKPTRRRKYKRPLPLELETGMVLMSPAGVVALVVRSKLTDRFDQTLYRLYYPSRTAPDGFYLPAIHSDTLWSRDEMEGRGCQIQYENEEPTTLPRLPNKWEEGDNGELQVVRTRKKVVGIGRRKDQAQKKVKMYKGGASRKQKKRKAPAKRIVKRRRKGEA